METLLREMQAEQAQRMYDENPSRAYARWLVSQGFFDGIDNSGFRIVNRQGIETGETPLLLHT